MPLIIDGEVMTYAPMEPQITSFMLGKSIPTQPKVNISQLEGNPAVTDYIITLTPNPPNIDDPNWTTIPPSAYNF
jgi:hypothetical protein